MDIEILDLGTKCTIIRAEELQAQMESLIQTGRDVQIDASKVEQVDTTALQLLISLHQALEKEGRTLSWHNPSEQTLNTAKLLGLDCGTIEIGKPADLCLFDLGKPWQVVGSELKSKSKNTAFDGHLLQGRVLKTLVRGKTVFELQGSK